MLLVKCYQNLFTISELTGSEMCKLVNPSHPVMISALFCVCLFSMYAQMCILAAILLCMWFFKDSVVVVMHKESKQFNSVDSRFLFFFLTQCVRKYVT